MADRDDAYVAVRMGRLNDVLDLADRAAADLASHDPKLASCLNGAVAEIRTDIRELV